MFEQALHWFGYGLCHQLPERSFFGGGIQVPVCARDTGIYLGLVVSYVTVAFLHRGERATGFPRPWVWLAFLAALAAMGFDGVSSYAGWRSTTNELRLITGLGVGFSAGALVYPMLQDVLWVQSSTQRVLDPPNRFGRWLLMLVVSYAVIWWGAPAMGLVYPIVVVGATVTAIALVNLVIVGILPRFDRRARTHRDLILPVLLAMGLAVVEIAVAAWVRIWLERL